MPGWVKGISFGLFTIGVLILAYYLVEFLFRKFSVLEREYTYSRNRETGRSAFSLYDYTLFRKFKEAVELAGIPLSPTVILFLSILIFFVAFFSADGLVNFLRFRYAVGEVRSIPHHDALMNTIFALLMGSLPLVWVFFRLQRKRQDIALSMIHVVQNFIGIYNPKLTLGDLISAAAKTMPKEIRSEWNALEMYIRTRPMKEALHDFSRRLQNEWSDDFADVLLMKGEYGIDITPFLHKLVRQMQVAKSNEQRRQAMISIYRVGTAFMVFCAFFVIAFNIAMDGNNYKYYFVDPSGRIIVAFSLIILFASLIIVVLSGHKRI